MKRNLFQILALAVGVLSTSAFVMLASQNNVNPKEARTIASVEESAPVANKMGAPLSTSIQRTDVGDVSQIHLKGTVVARRDFSKVTVGWALPEGVQLVSGNLESNSFQLSKGQTAEFEIVVSQSSGENNQIFFQAQSGDDDGNLGAVAEYNTTKQELIAKQLRANFLKAREKVKSGELRKIIF